MAAQPYRFTSSPGRGPLHELPPLTILDQCITLQLCVRRDNGGGWRARLRFINGEAQERQTAEIFCADSEAELWHSVRGLQDHHLRALYLSLA